MQQNIRDDGNTNEIDGQHIPLFIQEKYTSICRLLYITRYDLHKEKMGDLFFFKNTQKPRVLMH